MVSSNKKPLYAIEVSNLQVDYGTFLALNRVSFAIKPGKLVCLLGPSGCGKTTILNAISGLLIPTSGKISFNGVDNTQVEPQKRHIGLVFQNYALYPHMSIFKNIA